MAPGRSNCWFCMVSAQLAGFSEGSMGPDIHPFPEGAESGLMDVSVCCLNPFLSCMTDSVCARVNSAVSAMCTAVPTTARFSKVLPHAQLVTPCAQASNTKFMSAPASGPYEYDLAKIQQFV